MDTEFMLSSELRGVGGTKTDRLTNILKQMGANEYVTAPATNAYIEQEEFKGNNITLYWYEFNHPLYAQLYSDFVQYLSVIDLLFNVGGDSLAVLRAGEEGAVTKQES